MEWNFYDLQVCPYKIPHFKYQKILIFDIEFVLGLIFLMLK